MAPTRKKAISPPLARHPVELLREQLGKAEGGWVSGEALSRSLRMSRTAVWKHVRALRAAGYHIDSLPRRGYLLRAIPDLLLPQELREGLRTSLIGQGDIRFFPRTDSTNRQAKALAAAGATEGTVVIAEEQSAGRGRRGRTWFSPPRAGIYMSLILRPDIAPQEAPRFAILGATAAATVVRATTGLEATIKWPNDILVGGRKIGGILTEASMEMDRVEYLVIGVGLNVNSSRRAFPPELRSVATSVRAETGRPASRICLARRLLESLEAAYHECRQEGFAPIMERWRSLTEMLGRRVEVDVRGRRLAGDVEAFDADGALVLRTPDGELLRLFSGDVQFV
ncbi:MAG: biotin--[acetyl-CoA-carboxylase] ligase [Pseudomonadota bacterium]|nr:biotin--[acetyl-CoA-carboxylase] ligase [Pseudomonadota bacterium]